ncbi:MAG TPA: hypothetical protein PL140_08780 [Ferrovaceae bacterium]|nr:hypothetical protein [Ferrovaceae bacterium]
MAGRLLCVLPVDAAQAGIRRVERGVPGSQTARHSAEQTAISIRSEA